MLRDGALGPEASISKLYWSEYHQAVDRPGASTLLGADALVRDGPPADKHFRTDEPGAENSSNSWIDVLLLNARSGTVYAGTRDAAQHPRREHPRPPKETASLIEVGEPMEHSSASRSKNVSRR